MHSNILANKVKSIINDNVEETENNVMQAGHFILNYGFYDNNDIHSLHAIDNKVTLQNFSELSWTAGLDLIENGSVDRLLLLVNDWQAVAGFKKSLGMSYKKFEDTKNKALEDYYNSRPELPGFLSEYTGNKSYIEKNSNERWMFSESALRDEFSMYIIKDIEPNHNLVVKKRENEKNYIKYIDECGVLSEFYDKDEYPLLCENSADCAGEVVQLIKKLKNRDINCFINVYPRTCMRHVNIGCLLAKELFHNNLANMKIVNIAIPESLDANGIMTHTHFV